MTGFQYRRRPGRRSRLEHAVRREIFVSQVRNILVNRRTEALRNRGDQEGYAQQTNLFVFLLFITTLPVKTDAWIARIDGALLIGFLAHDRSGTGKNPSPS